MNGLKKSIGEKRWASLNNNISKTIERAEEPSDFLQKGTILSLLKALQAFAESQFNFFHIGFYGRDEDADKEIGPKEPYLEESKSFLPEYVLRTTLYQIEYDLSVIKQVIDQRQNGSEGEKLALKQADVLAYHALKPAIDDVENDDDANLLANTAVITYFSKVASVRVIPYAPIALIGMPYSAIDTFVDGVLVEAANGDAPIDKIGQNSETNVRDFLAIPHEIGHYVYWHGRLGNSRLAIALSNRLSKQPEWLERWLEEIFADIYGALIVGPTMALNFQELQKDFFKPTEFIEDDDKHPIPAIRPYIYTYILSKVEFGGEKAFDEISIGLDKDWENWLKNYDIPKEFAPKGTNEPINIEKLPDQIKDVVDVAYKVLRLNKLRKKKNDFWSKSKVAGDLFGEFADYVQRLTDNIEEEINKLPKVTVKDGKLFIGDDEWAELGKTGLAIDALKDSPKNNSNIRYKMLPEAWLVVFSMRRWTIAGPTGNPPTGT